MSDVFDLEDAYKELKQEFYTILDKNKKLSSESTVMREALNAVIQQDQSYPWDESEYCIGRKAGLDTAARIAGKALASVSERQP